jgi:hypothetical protein
MDVFVYDEEFKSQTFGTLRPGDLVGNGSVGA